VVAREDRRAEFFPTAARLSRSRDVRTAFVSVTGAQGLQTVIIALPDDRMGYVFDQLRDAGGAAALVLAEPRDKPVRMAFMWPPSPARRAVAAEEGTVSQIHEDSPVGLFFDYLEHVRSVVVQPCVAAQLVHGTPQYI
jgi:hypothetical protein